MVTYTSNQNTKMYVCLVQGYKTFLGFHICFSVYSNGNQNVDKRVSWDMVEELSNIYNLSYAASTSLMESRQSDIPIITLSI